MESNWDFEYDNACPLSFPEIVYDESVYTEIEKHRNPVTDIVPIVRTTTGEEYWGYAESGYLCYDQGPCARIVPCQENTALMVIGDIPASSWYWPRGPESISDAEIAKIPESLEYAGNLFDDYLEFFYALPKTREEIDTYNEECNGDFYFGDGLLRDQYPRAGARGKHPVHMFLRTSKYLRNNTVYGYFICYIY